MSQNDQIRAALILGRSLTPLDALQDYGCFRLAARIAELRREGLDIECKTETANGKRYARYQLRRPYAVS
ncbi:MAG: helix-turn-helix domain-containing protein [Planctomycetaceae bacterium]|nr:helix-turn-helix domain-containing protein [Planctomycetaceae bacterium]